LQEKRRINFQRLQNEEFKIKMANILEKWTPSQIVGVIRYACWQVLVRLLVGAAKVRLVGSSDSIRLLGSTDQIVSVDDWIVLIRWKLHQRFSVVLHYELEGCVVS
jgi:hypothetical protein